ncbi:inhibitor of nuclear factor kappa-B kinase subunit alpha-like [Ptychodera flava]|uniref:inhibitor of nuclear factor kappa-B kinase subunit alpha-like n=1 Tax=Ptychodera flava TaxID=63121 RepID=UPI003969C2BB
MNNDVDYGHLRNNGLDNTSNHSNYDSDDMELPKVKKWRFVEVLGTGRYGTVSLLKHRQFGYKVALKERSKAVNDKTMVHWRREVEIVQTLEHENVVKALHVVELLEKSEDGEVSKLPLEYCNGGDLRKVLRKPENCCGLQEPTIRDLVSQLAAAIEYLHNNKIMHRDIKPENITLHYAEDNKVVYKLTDFGYAVRWSEEPTSRELVGTIQYLAPEMHGSKDYSHAVDYWSFGTVIFESIIGQRPFAPQCSYPEWLNIVNKKQSDHICAFRKTTGEVQYSNELPTPNNLSQYMKINMERWLMWMLLLEPSLRGGPLQADDRIHCFNALDDILAAKVVNIYSCQDKKFISYPLLGEVETLYKLQEEIAVQCGIEVKDQLLLLPKGSSPDEANWIKQCWSSSEPQDYFVTVFDTSLTSESVHHNEAEFIDRTLPQLVHTIDSAIQVPYPQLRKTYRHAVYFCQQLVRHQTRLEEGYKCFLHHVLELNLSLSKQTFLLMAVFHKFLGKVDFFRESLELDLESYKEQTATGIESDKIIESWEESKLEFEKLDMFCQDNFMHDIERRASRLQQKISEKLNPDKNQDEHRPLEIENLKREAEKLFLGVIQTPKGERDRMYSCLEMSKVIDKSIIAWERFHKMIAAQISDTLKLRHEILSLLNKMKSTEKNLQRDCQKLSEMHTQRQRDVWTLLKLQSQVVAAVTNLNSGKTNESKVVVRV